MTGESVNGLYSKSLAYTYATNGVIGRYTGMTGNHAYSYDSYGRLSQINDIAYSRIANSNLPGTVTRPNNANTTWSYEINRDLVTSVANGTHSTYAYVNDAIARRTSMTKSGSVFQQTEVLSYTYNDRSEVTGAVSDVNQNYSYSYAFDLIGNRTNATLAGTAYSYTANLLNQYTAVNADTPTYDNDGDMLTSGAWTYTWNGENRLISATNGTQRLEFAYDYMGRRIFKKVYSGETLTKYLKFVYDGYKLVEELDGLNSDALYHRYVWQTDAVGLDVPVSVYDVTSDKTYFYHTDANKNITELTDNTGAVVAHYEYSPFGMQTIASGAFVNDNPFRFSSEYFDSETGLVYYNYRYYNPQLGRWLSRDPIEEEGGYNLYAICLNNAMCRWDHIGLTKAQEFCKLLIFIMAWFGGDPSGGNPDPPPAPPKMTAPSVPSGGKPKDDKKDNPKFTPDPLPWWAEGGQTVDNVLDAVGNAGPYIAVGAITAAVIVGSGGAAIPAVIPAAGKAVGAY